MPGPDPAVAACRLGVRRALRAAGARRVIVACSGGADSTALAAATAFEASALGIDAAAVIVDHGLQDGSAEIANQAAARVRRIGLPAIVHRVAVVPTTGGPEAAARVARYAVLREAAAVHGAEGILLGHTHDDQAESVLLGLVRGSGIRSLSGMAAQSGDLIRPLLDVTREQTRAACVAENLAFWDDPHNDDPRYLRVRARRALVALEADLGPGLKSGLARSANLARQDADYLDLLAAQAVSDLGDPPWEVAALAAVPVAVRTRWWRLALAAEGVVVADLSSTHVGWLEALAVAWRGQGPVDLPGGMLARRTDGRILIERR
ncbi:tRNA lysidine(34) synthetase TilS [Calidifontibacter terrae]